MSSLWQEGWVQSHALGLAMLAWRGVETQHIAATMRLVDDPGEQDLLESLLETSKPPLPPGMAQAHYLLSTPFRYRPRQASRFRRAHESGLWYGAESIFAVCAELAYWRLRFVQDSAGLLNTEVLTQHTVFAARVEGRAIDLTSEPWVGARAAWMHPGDYSDTHRLAALIREQADVQPHFQTQVQWIRYESVRAPGHRCAAVFAPQALSVDAQRAPEHWFCKASAQRVLMSDGRRNLEWTA